MAVYNEKTRGQAAQVIGDGNTLWLFISNWWMPEYLELFKIPKSKLTDELSTLFYGRAFKSTENKMKITQTVFKSLVRNYGRFKDDRLYSYYDIEAFAQAHGVNFGIAAEMFLESMGYIKTDIKTDKEQKIDLIKGKSKIQLKCAVIRDFKKKAYSMVSGRIK